MFHGRKKDSVIYTFNIRSKFMTVYVLMPETSFFFYCRSSYLSAQTLKAILLLTNRCIKLLKLPFISWVIISAKDDCFARAVLKYQKPLLFQFNLRVQHSNCFRPKSYFNWRPKLKNSPLRFWEAWLQMILPPFLVLCIQAQDTVTVTTASSFSNIKILFEP